MGIQEIIHQENEGTASYINHLPDSAKGSSTNCRSMAADKASSSLWLLQFGIAQALGLGLLQPDGFGVQVLERRVVFDKP